jgi:hypothetical protein
MLAMILQFDDLFQSTVVVNFKLSRSRSLNTNTVVVCLSFILVVDTRRRATAPLFVYLTKRVFSRSGEMKILLESPSSNLRELEIPN